MAFGPGAAVTVRTRFAAIREVWDHTLWGKRLADVDRQAWLSGTGANLHLRSCAGGRHFPVAGGRCIQGRCQLRASVANARTQGGAKASDRTRCAHRASLTGARKRTAARSRTQNWRRSIRRHRRSMTPASPHRKAISFTSTRPRIGHPYRCRMRSASTRAPHNNNIRAEIEQAAMLFDVDIRMMKAFARIESGYNPKVTTGKYKCLFQLSNWEFAKYWRGDIYDIRDCSIAAARKFATEAAEFETDVGRPATATEIYCIHQQGYQGCSFHYAAPHQLAWKNMYLTVEGQSVARHGHERPSGATCRRTSKTRSRAELKR